MAIIASLFAMLGRFAGRFINAVLGWATVLLFGRVEARRQTILGFVAIASLLWVATIVGVVVPDVGTFLVAAVPRPDFVAEDLVRAGMVAAVVLIPPAIGAVGVWLAAERPSGMGAAVREVLRGYPFTALLALMIVVLAGVALWRRIHALRRRWEDAHVPLMAQPGAYDRVVAALDDALSGAGLDVAPHAAPALLSGPPRLLERVSGNALGGMVPDRLMLLSGSGIEALVYPSDIAISGTRENVARARAAIASRLPDAPAWQTMSKEGQEIENRVGLARNAVVSGLAPDPALLREIDERLARVVIPYQEWETLYRIRLQVERDALASGAAASWTPETSPPPASARPDPRPWWRARLPELGAAVIAGLLALDVALGVRGVRDDR